MTGTPPLPPLHGIKVLDFSTLLPGPLASLILAEAGASIIKIERPGGEDLRKYPDALGPDSVSFVLLNRLKSSLCVDLKEKNALATLRPYLETADVLLEQFRPGVMARLGLGYDDVRAINPRIVYCSITGYGASGPRRDVAGHDLNYAAETGILNGVRDTSGAPTLPPVLAADIAGGAYPAVMNILLALRSRDAHGAGCHLDIAMASNMFTFAYGGLGPGFTAGRWPEPGNELLTGGSPRYQIYRTADGRFLAAAPLEERFWTIFCDTIGLADEHRSTTSNPRNVIDAIATIVAQHSAAEWRKRFANLDVCVSVVATLEEAANDPAFAKLFAHTINAGGRALPALPVPLCDNMRQGATSSGYAELNRVDPTALWSQGTPHD